MSELDRKQREFVALGAALASNCIPCMEYHFAAAGKAGITPLQIKEAVDVADAVRKVPARQVLSTVRALLEDAAREPADVSTDCARGCDCG